jgi:signal peptidase II
VSSEPAASPPVRHPRAVAVLVTITVVGIVLDQVTKLLVLEVLEPGRFVPLLGDAIGWQLVFNPGAAFGLPVPTPAFLAVSILVVVIVVRSLPHTTSLLQVSAYGLLLAGAFGNLIDRVVYAEDGFLSGEVVDFVAWGSFPRFNVADASITVGFVLLVLALLLEDRRIAAAERAAAVGSSEEAVGSSEEAQGQAPGEAHGEAPGEAPGEASTATRAEPDDRP